MLQKKQKKTQLGSVLDTKVVTCSGPCRILKMEIFLKIIDDFNPSTLFRKISILDV